MHRNDSDRAKFEELCSDPFDYWTDAEWDAYYERMAPYMESADASMRRNALERLCTAVTWAEPSRFWRREPGGPVPPEHAVKRVAWLTGLVSQAQLKFPETGPAFLGHLRYHGGDNPYNGPLREWLHGWLANPPQGVSTDKIRGTLVLLGDCGAGGKRPLPAGSGFWTILPIMCVLARRGCSASTAARKPILQPAISLSLSAPRKSSGPASPVHFGRARSMRPSVSRTRSHG